MKTLIIALSILALPPAAHAVDTSKCPQTIQLRLDGIHAVSRSELEAQIRQKELDPRKDVNIANDFEGLRQIVANLPPSYTATLPLSSTGPERGSCLYDANNMTAFIYTAPDGHDSFSFDFIAEREGTDDLVEFGILAALKDMGPNTLVFEGSGPHTLETESMRAANGKLVSAKIGWIDSVRPAAK